MSEQYTMIAYTNPVEGREDEYNKWYDEVHLPEFSALPGVVSGRRFKVAAGQLTAYAAVYELSTEPKNVFAAFGEALKNGSIHMSDAIDSKSEIVTLIPR